MAEHNNTNKIEKEKELTYIQKLFLKSSLNKIRKDIKKIAKKKELEKEDEEKTREKIWKVIETAKEFLNITDDNNKEITKEKYREMTLKEIIELQETIIEEIKKIL